MQTRRESRLIELHKLDLDARNPRFGGLGNDNASQASVLDRIVSNFKIEDVFASLASNGYFEAEPLVGRKIPNTDRYTIVEGNRRLAACLILAGDPRAAMFKDFGRSEQAMWAENKRPKIDPVPVICFDDDTSERELLSYLGVRHISMASSWDSYAKAAWVSEVVLKSGMTVSAVAKMIGDKSSTIARLLEGYDVVTQAVNAGVFRPEDSVRSGRGSVTSYPFSWVYTLLGYQATRKFLELQDGDTDRQPLPPQSLEKAGIVFRAMFGDKSRGTNSAVDDSRHLGNLASVLASPEKVAMLEQGKSVAEIVRASQPIDDRLRAGFAEARLVLQDLISGLSAEDVSVELANKHFPSAIVVRRLAAQTEKLLRDTIMPTDE